MKPSNMQEYARLADANDPLRHWRDQFYHPKGSPGTKSVYFCGNSLGLQPRSVQKYVMEELMAWRELAVKGHFDADRAWYNYHQYLQPQTGRLVGAKPEETVVMNSLTVNLHLLMASFYRPTPQRYKILIEAGAFSSDRYAVMTQAAWHGLDPKEAVIELSPSEGNYTLTTDEITAAIDQHADSLALVLFSGVQYYTGQYFDLAAITAAAHQVGAIAGFDLAHAAGNVVLQLHDWNVDFAAWCSYKYLNSGPGGSSGVFVHERHGDRPEQTPRLAGWWSVDAKHRFQMPQDMVAQRGAAGWQVSNAQVLPMAAHLASLAIFDEVGIAVLRQKSEQLTAFAELVVNQANEMHGGKQLKIITPSDPKQRGCQLSILMLNGRGREVFEFLQRNGVELDWRHPNVIRIAPVPLYNTFAEVFWFGELLIKALR